MKGARSVPPLKGATLSTDQSHAQLRLPFTGLQHPFEIGIVMPRMPSCLPGARPGQAGTSTAVSEQSWRQP